MKTRSATHVCHPKRTKNDFVRVVSRSNGMRSWFFMFLFFWYIVPHLSLRRFAHNWFDFIIILPWIDLFWSIAPSAFISGSALSNGLIYRIMSNYFITCTDADGLDGLTAIIFCPYLHLWPRHMGNHIDGYGVRVGDKLHAFQHQRINHLPCHFWKSINKQRLFFMLT